MNPDWQTSCSTIQEANLHLLNTKIFSDVVFTVGEQKEKIHAHKLILMSRSSVFAAMFSERWAANGASGDEEGGIAIPDISADIFNLFLEYVYANKFSCETLDEASGVLCVAHKYNVRDLQDKCVEMLKVGIGATNVINFHQLALTLELNDFTESTMKFILINATAVFGNEQFLEILPDVLAKVLSSDDICIDEVSAFKALMRWAENRCNIQGLSCNGLNKRELLGDLLYLIRFPLMTQKAFINAVLIGSPGILREGEIQELFIHFSGLPASTVPVPVVPSFSSKKRVRMASVTPYSEPTVSEIGRTWDKSRFGEWHEGFMLKVNRDICITEIEICPLFGQPSSGPTTLSQNFDVSVLISLQSPLTEMECVRNERFDSSCSERIQLRDGSGVNIMKSTSYKVELKISGSFVLMHPEQPTLHSSVNVAPFGEEKETTNFMFWNCVTSNYGYYTGAPNPIGHIKALHFHIPRS